jgi:hypothetical protein
MPFVGELEQILRRAATSMQQDDSEAGTRPFSPAVDDALSSMGIRRSRPVHGAI